MNLPAWAQWAIRQSLGTKRGALVISVLSGPIGAMIDQIAFHGKGSDQLEATEKQIQSWLKGVGLSK